MISSHSHSDIPEVGDQPHQPRGAMTQQRLNNLMVLHVHKSHTDDLDLVAVANDFIDGSDHRKSFFGSEFKQSDYQH